MAGLNRSGGNATEARKHATEARKHGGLIGRSRIALRAMRRRLAIAGAIAVVATTMTCGAPAPPPLASTSGLDVTPIVLKTVARGALTLPNEAVSIKFAVIGDSGRGTPPQYEVAAQMAAFREQFKFPFVLMLGDNIYEGPASPEDYRTKFEEPYRPLLDAGVKFYAVLGNHDDPRQVDYALFNMNSNRYYTFVPPEDLVSRLTARVRFFAIDSTTVDREQVRWLEKELGESKAEWKICFFHHPLYTSGRYRTTSRGHRWALEPILVRHGVSVVFTGHEHIYQRSTIQNGIQHFVSGGAGSLRLGDGSPAPFIARSFDDDYHFMLIEVTDDAVYFQAISRTGETIDAGAIHKNGRPSSTATTHLTR